LIRPHLLDQIQQVRAQIAFDVELHLRRPRAEQRRDVAHVRGTNVPLVGAWMNRDAGRTGVDADLHRLEDARYLPAARVAQRRYFIDIDGELRHVAVSVTVMAEAAWLMARESMADGGSHLDPSAISHRHQPRLSPRCCFTTSTISCAQPRISS